MRVWEKPAMPATDNTSGDLRINIISAYNLIVDSNVESPSTYAPEAFHAGVQFCNDGADTLWNVFMHIGDFANITPGIYPERTHPGLTGTFSFTHEGGSNGANDASRYIKFIAPGECFTQYWLLSYPRLDDNGNSVTQATRLTDDDLWLNFDVWATADDNGTPVAANETQTMYMRNEISAMANKIWPNGDNKVPEEYRQAILESLGWDIASPSGDSITYVGESFSLQGIWYDLGNVGAGFDNNGDLVPDRNAWMQPVGDPGAYDPSCFRLLGTFGLVIVKLNNGTEMLIPFKDQLYFENLPGNNTGAVGLVFYRFAALNGPCSSNLTPYQEVASGYDNEKFNGDYGTSLPLAISRTPAFSFTKNASPSQLGLVLPDTLTFEITIANTGPVAVGAPALGIPLIIEDTIPSGTNFIAGSAAADNTLPTGVSGYTLMYSTDGGDTWTTTEPAPGSLTKVRWLLDSPLQPGAAGTVRFKVVVPGTYNMPFVCNGANANFGGGSAFAEAYDCSQLPGPNSIGDIVWEDDGGTTGTSANGIKDGNEAGMAGIVVSLFFDSDGDGELDDTDLLWGMDTTNVAGAYLFSSLPDGHFIVKVEEEAVKTSATYTGWTATTNKFFAVGLDTLGAVSSAVSYLDADFGFAPALELVKTLDGTSPIYEGNTVNYQIVLKNNSYNAATTGVTGETSEVLWGQTHFRENAYSAGSAFYTPATGGNIIGDPDGTEAISVTPWKYSTNTNDFDWAYGFNITPCGNLTKVELAISMRLDNPSIVNDYLRVVMKDQTGGNVEFDQTIFQGDPAGLNAFAGSSSSTYFVDISSATNALNWNFWDGNAGNTEGRLGISPLKTANGDTWDGATLYLDAIGVRFTSDDEGCYPPVFTNDDFGPGATTIDSLPLTDTYDPTKLQYITASVTPNSTTPAGTLTWNDLGPLHAGQTDTLTVTFKALQPVDLTNGDTTNNVVNATAAHFLDGNPTNDATDTAGVRILRSGSIAGRVWSDLTTANGWQGTNGYQTGEPFIPNVAVVLLSCSTVANNGTCSGTLTYLDTIYTTSTGAYLFEGLLPNLHYRVQVLTSSIPGSVTQSGDPDDDPTNGAGNGGLCGSGGGNVPCNNLWNNANSWFEIGVDTWGGNSWDVSNINFGYSVQPSLFGNVWEDKDGDGAQAVGEGGLSGVIVELQNGTCTPNVNCTTTTTDANGNYKFTSLTAGTAYTLVVKTATLPAGSTWSETAESDASINNSISVTLTAGQISGSHNFGWVAAGTASLGDKLYHDLDGDGTQDANEEGIPNVLINLYADRNGNGVYDSGTDAFVDSASTNASGTYLFSNLPAGDYVVVVDETDNDMPAFFLQTADPDEAGICSTCNGVGTSTLTTGADLTLDFGYQPIGTATIGDLVWFDANGDGTPSGVLEDGIQNILVQLWADLNDDGIYVLLSTAVTDADGNYSFANLPDGNFRILVDSTDVDLPTDGEGNPVATTTNNIFDLTIAGGQVASIGGTACSNCDLDLDFGFAKLASVGDYLFWDADQDGQQDWNEEGIANVMVYLFDENGVLLDSTVTSDGAGTAPVGYYNFANLVPGDYTIRVNTADPDLGGATLMADPSADGVPCSDPTAAGCDDEYAFSLQYGAVFAGVDFGYVPPGVIGDFVWLDSDNDGLQDIGEPGIADVLVEITNLTPVTIDGLTFAAGAYMDTIYTDYDGYYIFSNLPNGTWSVAVQPGVAYLPTYDADAGLDNEATVVIAGGTVTSTGNAWCSGPDCSLDLDFGLKLNGSFSLSGNICVDDGSGDGICSTGGESQLESIPVYIYNDGGDYLGFVYTNSSGQYQFSGLPADGYFVAIGTALTPFDLMALTTTTDDTPATAITINAASVVQTVPVTGNVSGVDFAFEFVFDLDFGDLPAGFPTLLNGGPTGAFHILPAVPGLLLGAAVDAEADGSPSATTDGDDNTGDDEDGIVFNSPTGWAIGADGGSLTATVVGEGWLVGWIDFERDFSFADMGNLVFSQAVTTGIHTINFDIPAGFDLASTDKVYARFRLFTEEPPFPQFAYSGRADGGEVEDYWFITVDVNDPPIAVFDRDTTDEDMPVNITVLFNDNDTDGSIDPTTVTITGMPSNGMVLVDPTTGVITYTPNANFSGLDTLVYQVCDDGTPLPAQCDTAIVYLVVSPMPDIDVSATQTCNDNGTPSITTDDYFTIELTATNPDPGGSNQFEVYNGADLLATGTYGNSVTLEWRNAANTLRFVADGAATYSLTVRDTDNSFDETILNTTPEANCSPCPPPTCPPVELTKIPRY